VRRHSGNVVVRYTQPSDFAINLTTARRLLYHKYALASKGNSVTVYHTMEIIRKHLYIRYDLEDYALLIEYETEGEWLVF
jgi:hypothetical protein